MVRTYVLGKPSTLNFYTYATLLKADVAYVQRCPTESTAISDDRQWHVGIDASFGHHSSSSDNEDIEIEVSTLKLSLLAAFWDLLSSEFDAATVVGFVVSSLNRRLFFDSTSANLEHILKWLRFLIAFSWHVCCAWKFLMFHILSFSLFHG